jgi:hypothetical protein
MKKRNVQTKQIFEYMTARNIRLNVELTERIGKKIQFLMEILRLIEDPKIVKSVI